MDYSELFTAEDREANALIFIAWVQRNQVTVPRRGALVRDVHGKLLDIVVDDGRGSDGASMAALSVRWPQFSWNTARDWSVLTGDTVAESHALQINVTGKEWKRLAGFALDGARPEPAVPTAYLRANEREALSDGYDFGATLEADTLATLEAMKR